MPKIGISKHEMVRLKALALSGTPALNTTDTYVIDGAAYRWSGSDYVLSISRSDPELVTESRALTEEDNGRRLQFAAGGLTLTQGADLPEGFGCMILGPDSGTGTLVRSGVADRDGVSTDLTVETKGWLAIDPTANRLVFNYFLSGT